MLPVQKNNDIIAQITRVITRSNHIREVKDQLFSFIHGVESLNSNFAQRINRQMTRFEQNILKISFYYQKADHINNLSKLYRQFSLQIERTSKINLLNIQKIKQETILKQQQKLKNKCDRSINEFKNYLTQEKQYNHKYTIYNQKCDELTIIISRYKSYENPVSFYNNFLINEYLSELDKKNHQCSTSETEIITNRQMIDEKRGFLTETIKEVNENYFVLIHNYLVTIENIIKYIVYPKNQEKLDKTELNLRTSDSIEEQYMLEMQRLDNLYAGDAFNRNEEENPFEQFSDLFRKSVNQFEINSDYRFFHDRCDKIRTKKLDTSQQSYKIQLHLVDELKQQLDSYVNYERQYKLIEKDTFTNNGIESYKKRFRKYFGSNFTDIFELCLSLIERQKKSLEKISKNMEENEMKMRKILENKKQSINAFDLRSKSILQEHLKVKEKVISGGIVNAEEVSQFKSSVNNSFTELKKIFLELEKGEREDDKRFYSSMKSLYQAILKEATFKNLNKLLDKQKNRVSILNNMNINHQILLILKQDSRYQNLLNECPKPNLYSTFVSQIKKKEVDDTKILLQKKDQRLKNMIKPKMGCCGIKSEVVKQNVLSQHNCKLQTINQKYKGVLNISSNGLIFEESTWNPFADTLQLIIPQTDITSFDIRNQNEREGVEIGTDFGPLFFESDESTQILESMQKNVAFKGVRENSEQGNKRNDSSSFLKNNTSTEFKMSYDKSMSNGDLSKVIKLSKNNLQKEAKTSNKLKGIQNLLREMVKKWKQSDFFPEESFAKVVVKGDKRRDYQYHQGHSKFYLKQKRQYKMIDKDLVLRYEWKISFPDSPMLHSFKHHQQVRLENIEKQLRIRVTTAKYFEQQLYIKNKFYKEIEEMNKLLCQFIVFSLEKEADIINQQEYDQKKSMESFNIVLDDINIEERQSKFERTESILRNSKIEKRNSIIPNSGSKVTL